MRLIQFEMLWEMFVFCETMFLIVSADVLIEFLNSNYSCFYAWRRYVFSPKENRKINQKKHVLIKEHDTNITLIFTPLEL